MRSIADDKKPGLQREEIEKYVFNHVFLDDVIYIEQEKYTIYKFYPNYVMCKNKYGNPECFQYVDILNLLGKTVESVLEETQSQKAG